MQQPSAFCDGVIAWIVEMRKKEDLCEGRVRRRLEWVLQEDEQPDAVLEALLLTFIAGKMTPVMQITEATKAVRSLRMDERSVLRIAGMRCAEVIPDIGTEIKVR